MEVLFSVQTGAKREILAFPANLSQMRKLRQRSIGTATTGSCGMAMAATAGAHGGSNSGDGGDGDRAQHPTPAQRAGATYPRKGEPFILIYTHTKTLALHRPATAQLAQRKSIRVCTVSIIRFCCGSLFLSKVGFQALHASLRQRIN